MSLDKIIIKDHLIEIHNNWRGVQTVFVNKKIVSKKFSFAGTEHLFDLLEDGKEVAYILTTKISSKTQLLADHEILIDLKRDGVLIKENLLVHFTRKQKKENNKHKIAGIKHLSNYEIQEAIKAFKRGLAVDQNDPEIYFHLACCHSLEEQTKEAFEYIRLAVDNQLNDREMILHHEMLAFVRIQDGFKAFLESDFTEYDDRIFEK